MSEDLRLEGKCPKCNKPFFLRAEDLAEDRLSYFCPHCGLKEQTTPDMKQAAIDRTAREAARRTRE